MHQVVQQQNRLAARTNHPHMLAQPPTPACCVLGAEQRWDTTKVFPHKPLPLPTPDTSACCVGVSVRTCLGKCGATLRNALSNVTASDLTYFQKTLVEAIGVHKGGDRYSSSRILYH